MVTYKITKQNDIQRRHEISNENKEMQQNKLI